MHQSKDRLIVHFMGHLTQTKC